MGADFEISLNERLVETVNFGFALLDREVQEEVKSFVVSCQHPTGAFCNRAGDPDLYYSLFGMWLAMALELDESLDRLSCFVEKSGIDEKYKQVDVLALRVMQLKLLAEKYPLTWHEMLRFFFVEKSQISLEYKIFMQILLMDVGKKSFTGWLKLLQPVIGLIRPRSGAPCSLMAALLMARVLMKRKNSTWIQKVMAYKIPGQGFRAFLATNTADMLSSAVALFALKEAGADLRIIRPDCLRFVQSNYSDGAFLSGDGDLTRDLEYTFYGILALGSLNF